MCECVMFFRLHYLVEDSSFLPHVLLLAITLNSFQQILSISYIFLIMFDNITISWFFLVLRITYWILTVEYGDLTILFLIFHLQKSYHPFFQDDYPLLIIRSMFIPMWYYYSYENITAESFNILWSFLLNIYFCW